MARAMSASLSSLTKPVWKEGNSFEEKHDESLNKVAPLAQKGQTTRSKMFRSSAKLDYPANRPSVPRSRLALFVFSASKFRSMMLFRTPKK